MKVAIQVSLALGFLLLLSFSSSVHAAYFRADLPTQNANSSMGTHVIIAGKGMEVGDQWLRIAQTQALIFKDRAKHGQIRIIGAIENSNTTGLLQKWGYSNVQIYDQSMSGERVVAQLAKIEKIESIDFVGHNGAFLGFALEDYSHRFYLDDVKALASLKSRFSDDAVIRVMGCNTGWYLAPAFAKILGIPAAGTFTFADIQQLHETNEWFYNDEGRFPGGSFAKVNSISFSAPLTCVSQGGCLRLKAVSSNYQGKHGNYEGTLPFVKFFCGTMNEGECFRRMAKSTQYQIGVNNLNDRPSIAQFAEAIADQMCSAWLDAKKRQNCRQKVSDHMTGTATLNRSFTTIDARSMSCTFQGCRFERVCDSNTCVVQAKGPNDSTAFVDELNAYKAGYETWINSK